MRHSITLEAAAEIFQVHPRTIVRALTGQHNTYWSEDINHNMYSVYDIANAYNTSVEEINRVIEGREAFLKPDQAAILLGIRPRTFRDRVKAKCYRKVQNGGIVRYVRSKIIEDRIARS